MVANKSMGFRPWLQNAAASRLVAMLQNSISQAIQSYRSKEYILVIVLFHFFDRLTCLLVIAMHRNDIEQQLRLHVDRLAGLIGPLPERINEIRLSDNSSFWGQGYPALMLTDTSFLRNPHYHQSTDTPETLDYTRMTDVAFGVASAMKRLMM